MRFNLISKDGDGIGFAIRLQDEGNEVRVFIDTKEAQSCGDGLVPKIGSIHEMIADADDKDVFIFDVSGDGITADYIRSQGFPVIGGSFIADRLERERNFGLDVMKDCGIETPKSTPFTSFDDAINYVAESQDEKMVYKPSNLLGDQSPATVSYNQEDMIQLLEAIKEESSIENPEFVLQEFKDGIPVSTEIWFDGSAELPLMNHTFERKELMNSNLGPSGGCTGNIVWACGECPLCEEARKLVPWLKENNYHGPIDLNVIAGEEGIYGLEFTPRFGYDAAPTFLFELIDGDLGAFMSDVAKRQFGINSPQISRDTIAAGLRISVPPWPSERFDAKGGVPIFGVQPSEAYCFNVKRGDITPLATAGAWGILFCLTDHAKSVKQVYKSLYKFADKIKVRDKQYRTDLVDSFEEDLTKLEALIGISTNI